ncbi:MAG: alcohol dehydrogenase catalytic domain-containing protein [Vulcanimicrobiaceae bacterium]
MTLTRTAPIEQHPLALQEVSRPSPGRDELLVQIRTCGVCRSNLHMIEGDWLTNGVPAKLPIIPGHEICGQVAEIGESADGFAVGDRVGMQPLWTSCLRCEYCLTARENLCPFKEITGETVDGGYAQYVIAKPAHTYHVPDAIPDVEAAPLFCPGITAYHAVKKAQLAPGKRVALFGMGGVGHMVIQFAKLAGADVVTVARGKRHRELAEELGSTQTVDASAHDAGEVLKAGGGVDCAIVFAPAHDVLRQALLAVKPGGVVVNGAATDAGPLQFAEEKQIVGTVIGNREEMREVLRIAADGKVKVVAETFTLDRAEDALIRLKNGEIEARAVLVMS